MNKTDIINNCLLFLGLEPINNVDEDSALNKTIKAQYKFCLQEVMRSNGFDLGFRLKKLQICPDVKTNDYDFRFAFAYYMPENCAFLKFVTSKELLELYGQEENFNQGNKSPADDIFRVVQKDDDGRLIVLSNIEKAYGYYYITPKENFEYDIDIANVLTYLLAVKIAEKETGQTEKLNAAIQMFNHYKGQALARSLNRQACNKNEAIEVPNFLKNR